MAPPTRPPTACSLTSHRAARFDSRLAAGLRDVLGAIPDADELDTILRDLQALDFADGDSAAMAPAPPPERDDERPVRAPATESERALVDKRLLDALPPDMVLRTSQARHLAAIQRGDDRLLIAATGSHWQCRASRTSPTGPAARRPW